MCNFELILKVFLVYHTLSILVVQLEALQVISFLLWSLDSLQKFIHFSVCGWSLCYYALDAVTFYPVYSVDFAKYIDLDLIYYISD